MMIIRRNLIATTLLALSATIAFAGAPAMKKAAVKPAPAQVIHVSLTGEAGQPMGAKLDVTEIKAGAVTFDVANDAVGTDHEAVLVKLSNIDEKITADPKKHRVNEAKLKTLGEVAGLEAGKHGTLNVKLKPGAYALICNHKSHYELGMATRFTVTQ